MTTEQEWRDHEDRDHGGDRDPGNNDHHAPEWHTPAESESPARTSSLDPEASVPARLVRVKAAQNPLLEAALPLLRALADMPAALDADGVDVLHRLLVREVTTFQSLCSSAQVKHEHLVAASYALCTAIDEAANSTSWGGARHGEAGVWAARQLAVIFHDDARGGDKVFLLVGRLAASPEEHIDLLEVLYFVLGLGFEGRYGAAANGRRQLETIRYRLLTLLNASRGAVPADLSPHWKGVGAGKFRLLRGVPVWATASLLALALLGVFAWYKARLTHVQADVVQRIAALEHMRPPPVVAAALEPIGRTLRLKELLAAEIARGTVSVDEDERHSAVTFKGDEMFVPGQARLNPRILPVLAKVAGEIRQVSGAVQVVGHSDNRPIHTPEFADNQALSEKRAASVAAVLAGSGVEPSRMTVEGRGDALPVADNATFNGRARNRRVDIVVLRSGGR